MVRIITTKMAFADGNESAVEDWLKQEALPAYDAMRPIRLAAAQQLRRRASLAAEQARAGR